MFYSIKNLNITTYGGLFGCVNASATVKNVAFVNINISNISDGSPIGGIFGTEFCGKMENVFMSVTLNAGNYNGAFANGIYAAEIKNSVFVVGGELAGNTLCGALCNEVSWSGSHAVFENCYVVTELGKLWSKKTDNPDGTETIKITQGATSVEASGLDESIWDLSGNYPVYKN